MITKEDAMRAVSTLLKYIEGDDEREGLVDTPKRVIQSYEAVSYTHLTLPTKA